ncbi:TPA: phosphoribosylformylglycinamidine synthase I [Legionella pneumophila]|nr:phosphoribosylformylglycinamidine synthase I [Legionella pneumophila subsp. pneumophila]HAU0258411.1 phosphoribosylformylglycinamidine synthase I [Legionella pneumophila]HAT9120824.1 phosphoribosylformylglycinamidine synthase I [Legionella pneumophila subsp. pneumophila]HAT9192391.1 phosphoribosylformylglycinamidine synthase I [Legionella pneumophila subsp. pneumophila]HAT9866378.1 phosphoribosylformylglycinamidine synthase I [Legionella pneumophila subsp. pneumophila]
MMKIAVVQFPGSNCERETMLAVQRAGMTPVEFLWNDSSQKLREMDGYIIIGGFSYEDRSRAGIIAALDPVMKEIKLQSELGKPVLGICNGAQILVETGLVPGLKNYQIGMALTENKRIQDGKILGAGFYNSWIHMRTGDRVRQNAFTRYLSKDSVLSIPAAHAEGRFVMPVKLLQEIEEEGLNAFQYCDAQGNRDDNFPVNPNGSLRNIAAIINKAGNVMAIMPHPERTFAGDPIFHSMKEYIKEKKTFKQQTLSYQPEPVKIIPYDKKDNAHELIVKLIITDNAALTVQNTLRQLGIPVTVNRMMYWHVDTNFPEAIEKIKQTGVLYNDRKEYLVTPEQIFSSAAKAFLVISKDDMIGQQKLQMLRDHFSIDGVDAIHHGVLWIFSSENVKIQELAESILATNIIFNPNAHICYEYQCP